MYSCLLALAPLFSTVRAAKIPLGPGPLPIVPTEFDPKLAYPPEKRDLLVSESSFSPALTPTTSELALTTMVVTVTSTWTTYESAAPTNPVPRIPDHTTAGVYVCDDVNWNGACSHKFSKPGGSDIDCVQLSGRESSLGPDPGFICEFFTNSYCRKILADESDFLSLEWPGNADLRSTPKGDLNDKFFSYACFII